MNPLHERCVIKYGTGRVTDVLSQQAVEVNGVPRHVRNLRPKMATEDECKQARGEKGELEECPWFIGCQATHGGDDATKSKTSESEKEVTERILPKISERERSPFVRFCCE